MIKIIAKYLNKYQNQIHIAVLDHTKKIEQFCKTEQEAIEILRKYVEVDKQHIFIKCIPFHCENPRGTKYIFQQFNDLI